MWAVVMLYDQEIVESRVYPMRCEHLLRAGDP